MNAGVALIRAYLQVNGYFTVSELPVIRRRRHGSYEQLTDIDIVALRFPLARHLVSEGRPGPADDLTFAHDPALDVPEDAMDLIVGEVKEGRPDINPALRSHETLYTALVRSGCCPPEELDRVVDELRRDGEARLEATPSGTSCRIRLVAFGAGEPGSRTGFTVVSLGHVARFLDEHLERYHDILHPADLSDPVLGLLHLLKKVE
ncbi:MAG: hypothetical protein R3223_07145 [Longimicrobiales bacterium]|nr:hypothetical protein [Longimicrobiales bacterium]